MILLKTVAQPFMLDLWSSQATSPATIYTTGLHSLPSLTVGAWPHCLVSEVPVLKVWGFGWLSGEGIGLLIRGLPVRFQAVTNDVVSLGKALHPTCLGGMSLYLL